MATLAALRRARASPRRTRPPVPPGTLASSFSNRSAPPAAADTSPSGAGRRPPLPFAPPAAPATAASARPAVSVPARTRPGPSPAPAPAHPGTPWQGRQRRRQSPMRAELACSPCSNSPAVAASRAAAPGAGHAFAQQIVHREAFRLQRFMSEVPPREGQQALPQLRCLLSQRQPAAICLLHLLAKAPGPAPSPP